jgi:hypothetical protein
MCYLGEFTLVLELGYQSFVRYAGDIVTAVGTSLPQDHSGIRPKSTLASTQACIFCRWHAEISCPPSGRNIASPRTSFPIHLLRGPSHLSLQYQSRSVQHSDVLDSTSDGGIRIHHVYSVVLARLPILFTTFPTSLVLLHSNFVSRPQNPPWHDVTFPCCRCSQSH